MTKDIKIALRIAMLGIAMLIISSVGVSWWLKHRSNHDQIKTGIAIDVQKSISAETLLPPTNRYAIVYQAAGKKIFSLNMNGDLYWSKDAKKFVCSYKYDFYDYNKVVETWGVVTMISLWNHDHPHDKCGASK